MLTVEAHGVEVRSSWQNTSEALAEQLFTRLGRRPDRIRLAVQPGSRPPVGSMEVRLSLTCGRLHVFVSSRGQEVDTLIGDVFEAAGRQLQGAC